MSDAPYWNQRFAGAEYVFGTAPNAFLTRQKPHLPQHGRALAVGDGEGRNGVWLAQQGLDVHSIDLSPVAQAKARLLSQSAGVNLTFELADLANWNWPTEAYEVIVAIFIQFCGPIERAKIFAGIRQSLVPGALLLIEGYTPKQLAYGTGGSKTIENLYTRELLEREFSEFTSMEIAEYDAHLAEGTAHEGMSAVIDLVARK